MKEPARESSSPRTTESAMPSLNQLILSCQPMVRSIAWQISRKVPSHVDIDDLIAAGNIGLMSAAKRYQPDRGTRFSTFVHARIRGAILDALAKEPWFDTTNYQAGKLSTAMGELVQHAAREGAGSLDASLSADVRWLKDVVINASTSDLITTTAAAASGSSPLASAIAEEMHEHLRRIVQQLPDDARQLIEAMYFEGISLTEAAGQLNITKGWASRLHARTLRRLALALRALERGREKTTHGEDAAAGD